MAQFIPSIEIYKNICEYVEKQSEGYKFNCSFPVISHNDNKLTLSSFIYYYPNDYIPNGLVSRPSDWLYYSIEDGTIYNYFDKNDSDDFTMVPPRTPISTRVENYNKSQENYLDVCSKKLDNIRLNIIQKDKLDMQEYQDYILTILDGVSRDMKQFYFDLSIEIPKKCETILFANDFIPYINYKQRLTMNDAKTVLLFFESLSINYIILDKQKINFNQNNSDPYILQTNNGKRMFITNTYSSANALAKKLGQYLNPDMALIGAIDNLQKQSDLAQFLRIATSNKIDNISFGFTNKFGNYQNLLTCNPFDALKILGYSQNENYQTVSANETKNSLKMHKYAIEPNHYLKFNPRQIINLYQEKYNNEIEFVIQQYKENKDINDLHLSLETLLYLHGLYETDSETFNNLYNENAPLYQIFIENFNQIAIEQLKKSEIIYILMNDRTHFPLLTKNNELYLFTNLDLAHSMMRVCNDNEYRNSSIIAVMQPNIKEFLSKMFYINGIDGININMNIIKLSFENKQLYDKTEFLINYKKENTIYNQCLISEQLNKHLSIYTQILNWDVNYLGKTEEMDQHYSAILVELLQNKLYIPTRITRIKGKIDSKSGEIIPIILRTNTGENKKFIPCFTNIEEFKKSYNTNDFYMNVVEGAEMYSNKYDGLILNPGSGQSINLNMSYYNELIECMQFVKTSNKNIQIQTAYKLLIYPQISEEFLKVMRSKSLLLNGIEVNGFTAKKLIEIYKMNVLAAYLCLIDLNDKPKETLEKLKKI